MAETIACFGEILLRMTAPGRELMLQKPNLLVLDGWTILRFTWTKIKSDPAGVANEILAALGTLGFAFR